MSALLLYERACDAIDALRDQHVANLTGVHKEGIMAVDIRSTSVETHAMFYLQQQQSIVALTNAKKALTDCYRKLSEPDQAQKAPPEERGQVY